MRMLAQVPAPAARVGLAVEQPQQVPQHARQGYPACELFLDIRIYMLQQAETVDARARGN